MTDKAQAEVAQSGEGNTLDIRHIGPWYAIPALPRDGVRGSHRKLLRIKWGRGFACEQCEYKVGWRRSNCMRCTSIKDMNTKVPGSS